jgi:isopentenyl-diphosphate delta-isomerase
VSVCLVDDFGALLVQRRAAGKYHSANLWSNTCCGHPRPGERTAAAAHRRLGEEMGIECALKHVATFQYRAPLDAGLIEHEIDHVFVGRYAGVARPDPAEVSEVDWLEPDRLLFERLRNPSEFTPWFFLVVDELRGR